MKVFCLGNEHITQDSYAIKLGRELEFEDVDFIECQSADEFLEKVKGLKEIVVLDVAKDITDVKLVTNENIKSSKITTGHDFDIGFFMSLLKEMGELQKINIIAIPQKEPDKNIIKKVKSKIQKFNKN
ncbi:MAG: hypothetical protein ACOCQG_04820 [Candidatus Nanoarchaeia archaeon]